MLRAQTGPNRSLAVGRATHTPGSLHECPRHTRGSSVGRDRRGRRQDWTLSHGDDLEREACCSAALKGRPHSRGGGRFPSGPAGGWWACPSCRPSGPCSRRAVGGPWSTQSSISRRPKQIPLLISLHVCLQPKPRACLSALPFCLCVAGRSAHRLFLHRARGDPLTRPTTRRRPDEQSPWHRASSHYSRPWLKPLTGPHRSIDRPS